MICYYMLYVLLHHMLYVLVYACLYMYTSAIYVTIENKYKVIHIYITK